MHYKLRKKLWRSFSTCGLNRDPNSSADSIQKRDRIGKECELIAGGFSDKGQMI